MASVTTMLLVSDRPQSDGRRYVRYKFDLLDNNGQNAIEYVGPKLVAADFDTDADMISLVPVILASRADQEQQEMRDGSIDGQIVLHDDLGGYYGKKTPAWSTWDEQTTAWLKYWLSLEDQLELVNMQLDLAQISNTDLKNLLGIAQADTTDIRAAVQVAVDTKATLDTYNPFYVGGVWMGA